MKTLPTRQVAPERPPQSERRAGPGGDEEGALAFLLPNPPSCKFQMTTPMGGRASYSDRRCPGRSAFRRVRAIKQRPRSPQELGATKQRSTAAPSVSVAAQSLLCLLPRPEHLTLAGREWTVNGDAQRPGEARMLHSGTTLGVSIATCIVLPWGRVSLRPPLMA